MSERDEKTEAFLRKPPKDCVSFGGSALTRPGWPFNLDSVSCRVGFSSNFVLYLLDMFYAERRFLGFISLVKFDGRSGLHLLSCWVWMPTVIHTWQTNLLEAISSHTSYLLMSVILKKRLFSWISLCSSSKKYSKLALRRSRWLSWNLAGPLRWDVLCLPCPSFLPHYCFRRRVGPCISYSRLIISTLSSSCYIHLEAFIFSVHLYQIQVNFCIFCSPALMSFNQRCRSMSVRLAFSCTEASAQHEKHEGRLQWFHSALKRLEIRDLVERLKWYFSASCGWQLVELVSWHGLLRFFIHN